MTTPTQQTGQLRLPGVDVLRGLAVLFVLLHHIHLRFELNDYGNDHFATAAITSGVLLVLAATVLAFEVARQRRRPGRGPR